MILHGIQLDSEQIRAFCSKWMIRQLCVFGSILRDDFSPESDIDFLVDFHTDEDWDLVDLLDMRDELEALIGQRVDLVEKSAIEKHDNRILKQEILGTAELACAA